MNNFTDIITIVVSILFLLQGYSRGFLRALLTPFSIVIATFLSIIYYQITKEIVICLLIGLVGPFLLNFFFRMIIKAFAKASNNDIRTPNIFSAVAGAILTFAWGWVFIIFTLILLTVLPPWDPTMKAVHDDVLKSRSYKIAQPWEGILFSSSKENAASTEDNSSTLDAKSLAEDPRFQKIMQDPEIQKDIDAHDMVKLMSNPKMMELTRQIMTDPDMMKKVMTIYSNQAKALGNKIQSDSSSTK
jgi:hypothetical protein